MYRVLNSFIPIYHSEAYSQYFKITLGTSQKTQRVSVNP